MLLDHKLGLSLSISGRKLREHMWAVKFHQKPVYRKSAGRNTEGMYNPFRILTLLATRLPVRAITDVTPIDFTRACLYQCRKPPAKSGGATSASYGMSENDV